MKILYKCLSNHWFHNKTDEKMETYYLELDESELDNDLKKLLSEESLQINKQLKNFGKIYIIIDKYLNYSKCIPAGYGPYWPISGHWDMSDMFRFMYGIEIKNLKILKNIKHLILENSIDYLRDDNGIFGNIREFNFGKYGPEMFKSFIAESIVYKHLIKSGIIPIIPDEEKTYNLRFNENKIIIKTNGKKIGSEYKWYGDNSCWRKGIEINQKEWDYLYFVELYWNEEKYDYSGLYKVPYNNIINNIELIRKIKNTQYWYVPVEFDNYKEWLYEFKIDE